MRRLLALGIAAFVILSPSLASAGIWFPPREAGERVVPRDKTTGVLTVFNCFKSGGLGQGSFFADHGTVTFRESTANVCSQTKYPVGLAYYTPNPGFVGDDTVQIYYGPAPFRILIHVRDGVTQAVPPTQKKPHRHASAGNGHN